MGNSRDGPVNQCFTRSCKYNSTSVTRMSIVSGRTGCDRHGIPEPGFQFKFPRCRGWAASSIRVVDAELVPAHVRSEALITPPAFAPPPTSPLVHAGMTGELFFGIFGNSIGIDTTVSGEPSPAGAAEVPPGAPARGSPRGSWPGGTACRRRDFAARLGYG